MKKEKEMYPMWEELQEFVQQVEKEQKQSLEAKPYIDQIRGILSKYVPTQSTLETD